MKKFIIILFAFIGSLVNAQEYDFQEMCLACAEQDGFYCGDDPANWTQYSPLGCVPNGEGGLFYLNDGWEDCVDASDENGAVPTPIEECAPPVPECDTVFVDIIEYQTLFDTIYNTIYDTIIEYDTIVQIEYIQQTDTIIIYDDILDTLFVDVIEYVEVIVYDTIIEIQYEEIVEYIDCDSGLPCNSSIMEIIDKSNENSVIYNIKGQAVLTREGLYIENGKIYYKNK
tara:strand:- start:1007 stop:1690 length:684 start_codon:yes stop_codon:yes gene_type:complete